MPDPFDEWAEYNASRAVRDLRPLSARLLELAGPGEGRTAVDIGCGSGVEVAALLANGWRVHAVDGDASVAAHLAPLGERHPGALEFRHVEFGAVGELPTAGLIHSSYALPYAEPDAFARLWELVRGALRPGGWFGAHLFGDHDSGRADGEVATYLTRAEAHGLLDGWEVVQFEEEDAVGPSFIGPKHWHLFHVIARRPV
ncbi:MAG: methyltransferase [Actinomycetota bacterium]